MAVQPRDNLRALKALVGVMGVLIVVGTAVVIGVIIHRIYDRNVASPSITALPAPPAVAAALAPGEHIAGIAGAGGQVAVWVTGPAGDRVLLLSPANGAISVALTAPK
jgi:hypothetical protein